MDKRLTAVVITFNEEENIGRCLESLEGAVDEIIVLDSYSTDRTREICERPNVKFVQRNWEGYSDAKNYANQLSRSEYVLSIDADEALSPELKSSIIMARRRGFEGIFFAMKRLNNYCGAWIRHGEWYPDRKIRIFDRSTTRWEGAVHEKLTPVNAPVVLLDGDLLHFSYRSIRQHVLKSWNYSQIIAFQDVVHGKKRTFFFHGFLKPCFYFVKSYIIKLGFLDGSRGFVIALIIAWERFRRFSHYRELIAQRKAKDK